MSREPLPTNWLAVLVLLVTGYLVIFAQVRFTGFRDWAGTQPDLIPGLMVYASLVFNLGVITLCAAVLGVLFDSLSANVLGTTFISLVTIGFIGWRLRELLLSGQFTTHWVMGLAASTIAPVISLMVLKLAGADPLLGLGSLWHWAVMIAGGAAFTPLWFKLFNRLDEALRYKELPESAYRQDRQIARGRH